jgi:hypothetical protein
MTTPDPAFSLRGLIRAVIREHGIVSTSEARYRAAREVLARIPAEYRAQVALETMTVFIWHVVKSDRPQLRPVPALGTDADREGASPELAPPGDEVTPRRLERERGKSANSANSPAQAMSRAVGAALRATYATVPGKVLGDYTTEEVAALAGSLEKSAAEIADKAFRYRDLAARMTVLGVKRVRDLPADILNEVFVMRNKV